MRLTLIKNRRSGLVTFSVSVTLVLLLSAGVYSQAKKNSPAAPVTPRLTPKQQTAISSLEKIVAERKEAEGWFDVSTLKEPYRVEGKKTMGYELAEQFGWTLPDVILYPTGGGTGLIGMWKAFDEMEQMGWIDARRPRMVSVQAAGCAPIVRAFHEGKRFADEFENAHTQASGLRVPKAIGDFLILDALRESGGTAIAVEDAELIKAVREIGAAEGVFCAPEGAACLPALRELIEKGLVTENETVVIFNTGAGVKYLECF